MLDGFFMLATPRYADCYARYATCSPLRCRLLPLRHTPCRLHDIAAIDTLMMPPYATLASAPLSLILFMLFDIFHDADA